MTFYIGIATTPNRKDYLAQLLDSIEANKEPGHTYHVVVKIDNKYQGVHHTRNYLLNYSTKLNFDFGFLLDDDIFLTRKDWATAYFTFAMLTGHHHLTYHNTKWPFAKPGRKAYETMGCLHTFTPQMLKDVGYYDTDIFEGNIGGHYDWSCRACRAGYNVLEDFVHMPNQSNYVGMQIDNYKRATERKPVDWIKRRKALNDSNRIYVPL